MYVFILKVDHSSWNILMPRLVLILLVAEAKHCCWLIEQPTGSTDTLPYHPRLDWMINQVIWVTSLQEYVDSWCHGSWNHLILPSSQVFRTDFWMLHYGGSSPKRTTVWSSNGDIIEKLVRCQVSIVFVIVHICRQTSISIDNPIILLKDLGCLTKDVVEKKRTLRTTCQHLSNDP